MDEQELEDAISVMAQEVINGEEGSLLDDDTLGQDDE